MKKSKNIFFKIVEKFPLRLNFLYLVAFIIIAWYFGYGDGFSVDAVNDDSSSDSFIVLRKLLFKLFFVMSLVILFFSIISSLVPFLLFLFSKKKEKLFTINQSDNDIHLRHSLPLYYFPFLGKLKFNMTTNDEYKTEDRTLKFFNKNNTVTFRHFDEYTLDNIRLQFSDLLHLFNWNYSIPFFSKWWQNDFNNVNLNLKINPSQSQDDTNRIDTILHAPGEWLNQKDYEYGDDVRRIIWKIYAKNKSLQIKTQEFKTPFAQKILLVLEWSTDVDILLEKNELSYTLLDYYKSFIYEVINRHHKNGFSVKVWSNGLLYDDEVQIKKMITSAQWQSDEASEYTFPSKSKIITHTFVPNKLINMLDANSNEKKNILCSLLHLLNDPKESVLKSIFLSNDEDEWTDLRRKYKISKLRNIGIQKEELMQNIASLSTV